jgi:pyruvate dehydrogenase E1 component alpha subunit
MSQASKEFIMPKVPIQLNTTLEHLSILDDRGNVDTELEPDLPQDMLLKLFRAMVQARRFDERLLSLQRQGRIGTFPPITGQEAAQLGAVAALRHTDWMVPSFREAAAEAWKGRSFESILLYLAGYNEGVDIAPDQYLLPMSVPVSSQILHAVGIGWSMHYRNTDDVVMTFFGDGATSEGDFHEGLNFAAVFQSPVVFVCQNNHWAISVPLSRQTRSQTLAQKAVAYGMPGVQVDGNDVLAVYVAAKEAVDRARKGQGPTFIECVTYRLMMHTTADDPKRYRSDEEVQQWKVKDPIVRYQNYLSGKKILDAERIEEMEKEIQSEIQAAIDNAEKMAKTLGNPLDMFDNCFEQMPPHLISQKNNLKHLLAENAEEEIENG